MDTDCGKCANYDYCYWADERDECKMFEPVDEDNDNENYVEIERSEFRNEWDDYTDEWL